MRRSLNMNFLPPKRLQVPHGLTSCPQETLGSNWISDFPERTKLNSSSGSNGSTTPRCAGRKFAGDHSGTSSWASNCRSMVREWLCGVAAPKVTGPLLPGQHHPHCAGAQAEALQAGDGLLGLSRVPVVKEGPVLWPLPGEPRGHHAQCAEGPL